MSGYLSRTPTNISSARVSFLNLLGSRMDKLSKISENDPESSYLSATTDALSGIVITRRDLERLEETSLAPFAAKSSLSRGRVDFYEPPHPLRTEFMRDRDRLMHSFRLRRLEHIRQVAYSRENTYKRTRISHTLEVLQLTLTSAEILRLNLALAMAAALEHDVGHPVFAHDGEMELDSIMRKFGKRFEHNLYGYRILRYLTRYHPNSSGLNLTLESLYCIIMHCSPYDRPDYSGVDLELPLSPPAEGQLVNATDEIAYIGHDTDDALQSNSLDLKQLGQVELFRDIVKSIQDQHGSLPRHVLRHQIKRKLIDILFTDMILESAERIKKKGPRSIDDIYNDPEPIIGFSERMMSLKGELRRFLYDNVYTKGEFKKRANKARAIVRDLFWLYMNHPEKRPPELRRAIAFGKGEQNAHVAVCDFVAGMTDAQAEALNSSAGSSI